MPLDKTQEPTFPSIKKTHRSCSKASGSVPMDSTANLMGSGAPSHAPMKYVYVYACVRVCVYACMCMRVCMRVSCAYVCVFVYMRVSVYMCVCTRDEQCPQWELHFG